jgi:hypothetical protein
MGWYYNIAENMYMNGMHDNHVEVYMWPWKNKMKIRNTRVNDRLYMSTKAKLITLVIFLLLNRKTSSYHVWLSNLNNAMLFFFYTLWYMPYGNSNTHIQSWILKILSFFVLLSVYCLVTIVLYVTLLILTWFIT